MRLHKDRQAFEVIVEKASRLSGVRRDVLEKDYYVTLLLWELAGLPQQAYAYFKGGTALYKALRSIRRFSEDIDLGIYIDDCPTASQEQKRLKNAVLKLKSLPLKGVLQNRRGSLTCEYEYRSLYDIDVDDVLQRYGNVRVEGTSFTVSKPVEEVEIVPYLFEVSGVEDREILRKNYSVEPFMLKTVTLERIFTDKIFAAEFYYVRRSLFDAAKHIYDLAVLMSDKRINAFLQNKADLRALIALKRAEEQKRLGGVPAERKISAFTYFDAIADDSEFAKCFADMQRVYVFAEKDKTELSVVFDMLQRLRGLIRQAGE